VLCGEHRDFPYMLRKKLQSIIGRTIIVPKEVEEDFDPNTENIWQYFTGERYRRLRWITSTMHSYWQDKLNEDVEGWPINYNFTNPVKGDLEGPGSTNRVEHSVPPLDHCQMKFIFEKYLVTGRDVDPEEFDCEYETYKKGCKAEDFEWVYNNRGHKNFQPLWLDSNAMIWHSRVAARRLPKNNEDLKAEHIAYYKRPFASRYAATKAAWGTYLFYPDAHDEYFRQASESGGGPQVYVQNTTVKPGIAEYRLNPEWMGQGDIGLGSQARPVKDVLGVELTSDFSVNLKRILNKESWVWNHCRDWGFLKSFKVWRYEGPDPKLTFAFQMKRLNQAMDRHTNWGPTMLLAYLSEDKYKIYNSYSPLVAASYMIDASHNFATSDYPTTHPDEKGKTKWMYIMKFPKKYYYSEEHLKRGDRLDWRLSYLNETSLSNDFYRERALNHFATIPPDDIDANLYLAESGGAW
ncbi:hypothetical protein ACFLRA_03470, partial [Bdellovibrionota bacterium]